MGEFSLVHWLVVLLIVVLLFGAGKLPHVMGDFAKGIKAFKAGMRDDEKPGAAEAKPQVPLPDPALTAAPPNPAPSKARETEAATAASSGEADRPTNKV
jgi:sec-independent protein translocase protein TatA